MRLMNQICHPQVQMNSIPNPPILQWNINGFRSKHLRLLDLMQEISPAVVALQETKLATDVPMKIKNFDKIYRRDRDCHGGGICIAIHNSIPSHEIVVITKLEMVACSVMFRNTKLTICNVYFNNDAIISLDELNVINSLPPPVLLLGDINGKHPSWGSPTSDIRGNIINDWALENDKFILNDGAPTRYDITNDNYSHIDISMVDSSQSDKFSWKTLPDRLTSDHFPIVIEHGFTALYVSKLPTWIIGKADWDNYRNTVNIPENIDSLEDPCKSITNILLDSAALNIPKSKTGVNTKFSNCWWNEECEITTQNTKKQFNKVKRNSTPENVALYYELEDIAKNTLMEAKKNNWDNYVSTITRTTSIKEIWTKIKAISGKNQSQVKIILDIENNKIGEPSVLVEKFGQFFCYINSNSNYTKEFLAFKAMEEAVEVIFHDRDTWYNKALTMEELEAALDSCTSSSPGTDDLHYSMFIELNNEQKCLILNFFNFLWINNIFPDSWRTAIVIPILKPGKTLT